MDTSSDVVDETAVRIPAAGDVVCGKYRLLRPLGEGGMGLVFEAEHLRLRQSVAIKFLRSEVLVMPDALERFEREARASARLRGPHVVQVLDVDTDERGRPYMVMELLRGRDLEAELRVHGPFPVERAVDLVLQACVAVAQAHAAGVVHRDLKPSNLFLTEEAGKRVLKVLDFGISKIAPETDPAPPSATSTCMTVGTPLYMSPEQMRSSKDVDGRSDIWSLGVILYELVAGTPPFLGTTTAAIAAIVADAMPSLRRVRPDVPEALERVLITALAKAPGDRLPTVEALAAALMPFASADGVAGPFSLRPSQRDFALAVSAMARTPSSQRVSDVRELLELPASRRPRSRAGAALKHSSREALRTFASTLVIGMGLASAMTVVLSRHDPPAASSSARALRVIAAPAATAEAPSLPIPRSIEALPPVRLIATSVVSNAGAEVQHAGRGPGGAPIAQLATPRRLPTAPANPTPAAVRRSPQQGAGSASGLPHVGPPPSPYL
jgi:serine/threonine-protein kinase